MCGDKYEPEIPGYVTLLDNNLINSHAAQLGDSDMANNNKNNNGAVSWKFMVSVAAGILIIFLGITSWLISRGYDNIIDVTKRIEGNQKEITTAFFRRCEDAEKDRHKIDKRVLNTEILLTMPYDQRIKALEKINGINR